MQQLLAGVNKVSFNSWFSGLLSAKAELNCVKSLSIRQGSFVTKVMENDISEMGILMSGSIALNT